MMVSISNPREPFRRRKLACSVALLIVLNVVTAFQPHHHHHHPHRELLPDLSSRGRLISTSSTSSTTRLLFAGTNNNKKIVSTSGRERRDEENRKRERKDDVVIGKTSAKKGEKDYQLNPKATEEEWVRQASTVERNIYQYTEKGMEHLKMLQLEEANECFERVFEWKPNAYLWQAGIAKFYLGDYEGAADIFARNAATFESRFGGPASEERIWRDACELKRLDSMDIRIRKKCRESGEISTRIRQIPPPNQEDMLSQEGRKGIRITRDLFEASIARDHSAELLSRAKLRSLGGNFEENPRPDLKMWKLNAWFYLGLHHDATGDFEASKKCMKMALRLCPSSGNANDIIHTLPLLHMSMRDWFDDDDFEGDPMADDKDKSVKKPPEFSPSPSEFQKNITQSFANPLIEASIQEGVGKLKMADLQDALSLRGLKTTGAKEEIQERLFYSLMDDTGFDSGFA